MGELTRTYDWSTTSLGVPSQWPQSLRTTVNIILRSRFPMFLWWGPELIQFYNDAYRPSLGSNGKHPAALGQPGAACWPEIWPVVKPLIDQVWGGGEATWREDELIPIYRNGQLENVYWTFSYSPVSDESGHINGVLVTCTETTRQVSLVNQLQNSEQRFRNLVREASIGIIVLHGPEMRVDVVNDAYAQLIDRRADDLSGNLLFDIIPEAEEHYRDLVDTIRTTGEPLYLYDHLYFFQSEGGRKEGFLNMIFQPFRELDGIVTGVIVLCQEITEQVVSKKALEESERQLRLLSAQLDGQVQERTQQLAAANQELQGVNDRLIRSNQSLERFASVASHDLQEPLRKVKQFGDLLKSQYALSLGEGVEYVERMQSAANRMSILIRDLLSFSRISTGRDNTELVSLTNVVDYVLLDMDLRIDETSAVISRNDLPTVTGDASQLAQLFHNLLSNALKFRQEGVSPLIHLSALMIDAANLPAAIKPLPLAPAYYRIDIEDNGTGFEIKHLDTMFQMFKRLHGKNQYPGTGIGLAICEKVVSNHGGAITATSQPGQGATFSVYLPV